MNNEKINFPDTLICDDVVLERIEEFHTEDLYNTIMENKDHLKIFMRWLNDDYSLEDQEQFINAKEEKWENGDEFGYVIIDKNSDKIIGVIDIFAKRAESKNYVLGYWLIGSSAKKGIMSDCVGVITGYLINEQGAKRININTNTKNIPSMKVALKNNYLFEGIAYDYVLDGEEIVDVCNFSKLADESKMKKLADKQDSLKKIFDLNL